MSQYAMNKKTVNEAVSGGGLLVVAQWEAKEGHADRIADILSRFLPEAQNDPGAKLFLIGRSKVVIGSIDPTVSKLFIRAVLIDRTLPHGRVSAFVSADWHRC